MAGGESRVAKVAYKFAWLSIAHLRFDAAESRQDTVYRVLDIE